ncbi:hypothetical protein CSC70_03975 [Pseudoxanthomonas kalamensis DSM 18571]|uniref:hypothetical protein n=1 Tax=Pseudoxanthomonas kalamensis TaxID=289483 RepID=UPI0013909333|nr:hypothetical protein [Pseudoxanthomonas kalamensis]KAF1711094.1 hypothetical protein CSC70_03975 [Pseudoxanthomonas kalamensis DSM 18571]
MTTEHEIPDALPRIDPPVGPSGDNKPVNALELLDNAAEQVRCGAVCASDAEKRRVDEGIRKARDAMKELIEAAGKAQDTNREDYVLGRPDVSGLPEAERAVFLRGWDAASEAVFRTGLRAALRRARGGAA